MAVYCLCRKFVKSGVKQVTNTFSRNLIRMYRVLYFTRYLAYASYRIKKLSTGVLHSSCSENWNTQTTCNY